MVRRKDNKRKEKSRRTYPRYKSREYAKTIAIKAVYSTEKERYGGQLEALIFVIMLKRNVIIVTKDIAEHIVTINRFKNKYKFKLISNRYYDRLLQLKEIKDLLILK